MRPPLSRRFGASLTGLWHGAIAGLLAAMVLLALAGLAGAQGTADPAQPEAPAGDTSALATLTPEQLTNPADLEDWQRLAARAEDLLAQTSPGAEALVDMRAQLVDWRAAFLAAQSTNATRIQTLRQQIDALGPAPAEGETEPLEIADRRKTLTDQLVRLQAPGIAAEEARALADGLIKEIDRIERERQANELLKLWPSPLNPANWSAAWEASGAVIDRFWTETRVRWQLKAARDGLLDNLPLVFGLLVIGIGLIWRGRHWIETRVERWQASASDKGRRVWTLIASLGQIVVPTLGAMLLSGALAATEMFGEAGLTLIATLPLFGFIIFFVRWISLRVFPRTEADEGILRLTPPRRAEGRFLSLLAAFVVVASGVQSLISEQVGMGDAAYSVFAAPILIAGGFLLFRFGQLLRRHVLNDTAPDEPANYRNALVGLIGRGAMAIGVAGPVLALVGYVSAADALVLPGLVSLAVIGVLLILHRLVVDVYALLLGSPENAAQALVPTLVNFLLTLATVPLFALIWGARLADLTEIWTRFREGFQLGSTRISPTDFLYFAIVFAIGYTLTRLFQGALKTSILPKTRMDQGGQNAVAAGVGYVGIFLAALVAINAAGIDLSGLAIVAGALSVGIGFGLQNIVSNFVSGIILLIERPVSEGDWIEVGGVQGVVKSISVRSTRIQTFDRSDVIVPNADLVSGRVTNMTRFNLSGRLILPVGVEYGSDTRKVEAVLREVAESHPMVILEPPPMIAFMGFGADALNFEVRAILRDVNFSLSVRSEMNHEIARRFAEEGIQMPFPQRDLWLKNPEAVAEAMERLRRGEAAPASAAPVTSAPATPRAPQIDPTRAPQPYAATPLPKALQDSHDGDGGDRGRDDDGDEK